MQKKQKNQQGKILILAVLVFALGIYIYLEKDNMVSALSNKSEYTFAETGVNIKYNYEDKVSIYTNGVDKHFYFSSKDGMKYISSDGSTKWVEIYEMANPILKGEGGFSSVFDNKGNLLYVFDNNGMKYKKQFDYPIISSSINKRGDTVVILKNDLEYEIYTFDFNGNMLSKWEWKTQNIFPLNADVSDDGNVLAVSFVNINNITLSSKLVLINLNEKQWKEKGYEDGTMSGFEFENQILAGVNFLDSSNLVLLSDTKLSCIEIEDDKNKVSTYKWEMPLNNRVDGISFQTDKNIAIALGNKDSNDQSESLGKIDIYDLSLSKISSFDTAKNITYFSSSGKNLIYGSRQKFAAINSKGDTLWEYTGTVDVESVHMLDDNTIVSVTKVGLNILKLKR